MHLRKSSGFTLIELMIVIVVIGILVAIGVPNLFRMSMRAKLASVKHNMHAVQVAAEDFAARNNGGYPSSALDVTADGGLRLDQVLRGGGMPENPFTNAPTTLDWSNALGTPPATDPAGGVALNVTASSVGGAWDSYDILAEDETGTLISLVLRNH